MPSWLTVKPLLFAVGALLVLLGVQQVRVSRAHTATASARTELAEIRADIAEQRETFERLARAKEKLLAVEMAAVAAAHEQRMIDVEHQASLVADDLRTGALRLRQHWDACRATADLSGSAASAAQPDAAADLRRTGAVDLVRIADQCDTRIVGLQSAIRVMQGAGQ